MHDSISTRFQIRRPLGYNSEEIKEPVPEGRQLEHLMGSVAV